MKVKEWCIALDNVSSYIDSVLGLRYKFLKGERATKEKVFSMIPSMTEEEYARYFRPATEEEINGEFEWDGEQYVLEKPKRIKSIKEKSEEYGFQNPVIHYDADGNTYDDVDKPSMDFEAGANYVLEQIENFMKGLNLGNSAEEKFYKLDVLAYIGLFIEQLKK